MPSDARRPDSHRNNNDASAGERRVERLNWLGRVVYASGAVHRWSRRAAEVLHDRTATVAARSRQAFYDGLNPDIDEATILSEDETSHPPTRTE
jgi:hypothetical protein